MHTRPRPRAASCKALLSFEAALRVRPDYPEASGGIPRARRARSASRPIRASQGMRPQMFAAKAMPAVAAYHMP